ncbi:unnamed protein product [Rotaria sp. Silwood1]|nr:unnamed protein product [Rotaria sp. Silwood1]
MATATQVTICVKCKKTKSIVTCKGCSKDFCLDHINEHYNELSEQLGKTEDQFNAFKIEIDEQKVKPQKHELIKQVDTWERESIEKIRQVSNELRHELSSCVITFVTNLDSNLKQLTERLIHCRKENDFAEPDIQFFNEELKRLKDILNNSPDLKVEYDSTSFINKIRLTKKAPLLRGVNLNANAKWIQNGITVAGGNGEGNGINQIYHPNGFCVDDDQTLYIAEYDNHRIMEWKCGAKTGRVMAGGNGEGNRPDQLNGPTDVIIDKERDSLIICDYENKRVVRWPRQNGKSGETIISNVSGIGLTMDDNGFLYVVDRDKHEVRRYQTGDDKGIVVAGGNRQGSFVDQLNRPAYVFVDQDHSVYISDTMNHRVMKWLKDAKQGIVVAGGQGQGNNLTQLSNPRGIGVDQSGTVYVADQSNHRIMRWTQGTTQGSVVVGGRGQGNQSSQLSCPNGLSFDRNGNMYVGDYNNNRVQKFIIDQS